MFFKIYIRFIIIPLKNCIFIVEIKKFVRAFSLRKIFPLSLYTEIIILATKT